MFSPRQIVGFPMWRLKYHIHARISFTGDRYFDRDNGVSLATNLRYNIRNKQSNTTLEDDGLSEKMIDPNSDTCCDIYFLIDMSESMTDEDFEKAKDFIKALLPEVST